MEAKVTKAAKTSAVLLALVVVFICFNAPATIATDEHPWDQEGGGGSGTRGDSIKVVIGPTASYTFETKYGEVWSKVHIFLISAGPVTWIHDVPRGVSVAIRGNDVNRIDKTICTKAK